jgi:hypothetical protein
MDEFEILDDMEEKKKSTYDEDNSFLDMNTLQLGIKSDGLSSKEVLNSFKLEDTSQDLQIEKSYSREETPIIIDAPKPTIDDEFSNTMLLNKQEIKNELKEEKESGSAVVFIVILFILLAAFIFLLPLLT